MRRFAASLMRRLGTTLAGPPALLALAAAAAFLTACPTALAEETYKDRPLEFWIDKLKRGSQLERREAAGAMGVLTPQREDVVRLLTAAVDQRSDYELQIRATNALANIGPFARDAIPALLRTLSAMDLSDDSAREQAASALASIASKAPVELTRLLESTRHEGVLHGVLRAVGYLRINDQRTVAAMLNLLNRRPDTADALYEKIVWALWKGGKDVASQLVENLRSTKSRIGACGIVDALGHAYFTLAPSSPEDFLVDALLHETRATDDCMAWRAVRALDRAQARSASVHSRLQEILRDGRSESILISATADAVPRLFPGDPLMAELIVSWIPRTDQVSRSNVLAAAKAYGKLSVPPILAMLGAKASAPGVIGSASVLANRDLASREVVRALQPWLRDANTEIVEATLEAVAELGPYHTEALPDIVTVAVRGRDETRAPALKAVAAIAQFALDHDAVDESLRPLFERAQQVVAAPPSHGIEVSNDEAYRSIALAISRIQAAERARLTKLVAFELGLILTILLIAILSWRLQRWLRVLFGQRWVLQLGKCDYEALVASAAGGLRVTMRSLSEARSNQLERVLPRTISTASQDAMLAFQNMLGRDAIVRVEVEEREFGQPWALLIGGGWNSKDGTVGGQVCLVDKIQPPVRHYHRRLEFRALACSRSAGNMPLPMADFEVQAVAAYCRRWGAATEHRVQADRAAFSAALRGADIVHVCAHATYDRVDFADGPFQLDDLQLMELAACRCRLLILSACNAADLQEGHALMWSMVRAGINVIAATRPVHDFVCSVLFAELYAALLPTRRREGVILADAVRQAVARTETALASKYSATEDWDRIRRSIHDTLASFVIFGDPSLSLKLAKPATRREVADVDT